MLPTHTQLIVVFALLTLGAAGCGGTPTGGQASSGATETAAPPATVESSHEHAHASAGPHGGGLIELGNEEYHAELVHDDTAGTVTVYILDSAARSAVPIDATEVIINLKHDGRGEQFKLASSADQGEPAGKSSRFVSSDAELAEDLDKDGAEPQLVVTISGKQYRGAIAHELGHEHEHAHENNHAH